MKEEKNIVILGIKDTFSKEVIEAISEANNSLLKLQKLLKKAKEEGFEITYQKS